MLAQYNEGKYEEALESAKTLARKNPKLGLSYLIEGEIYFRKGDYNSAQLSFEKALAASKSTNLQKARALSGLGRIASLKKQTDDALNYFRLATETAPGYQAGYISQALLLDELGNSEQALGLLTSAGKLAPQDRSLAAITNETRQKVALLKDREKTGTD